MSREQIEQLLRKCNDLNEENGKLRKALRDTTELLSAMKLRMQQMVQKLEDKENE